MSVFATVHSVVFVGSTVRDPEDDTADSYIVVEAAATDVVPKVRLIGGATTDANGVKSNDPKQIRRIVDITFLDFVKYADGSEFQDYSLYLKLSEELFTLPYLWLYAVRELFGQSSVLPRADFDRTDPAGTSTSYDTYWNRTDDGTRPGILPLEFVFEDGVPEPTDEGSGVHSWKITATAAETEG